MIRRVYGEGGFAMFLEGGGFRIERPRLFLLRMTPGCVQGPIDPVKIRLDKGSANDFRICVSRIFTTHD